MPINPSFTGNRYKIPRDQLSELSARVKARIQKHNMEMAKAKPQAPAKPQAVQQSPIRPAPRESSPLYNVAQTDAIYQSTVVGNRSESARNIVSERTGVPPENLTYRSELGQDVGRGIVGTGLMVGGALAAPAVTPYVLPVGKAIATNMIGGAIADTAARGVFGDDAVDEFTYNYMPAISVGLGTLPASPAEYAKTLKPIAQSFANRMANFIMNTKTMQRKMLLREYPDATITSIDRYGNAVFTRPQGTPPTTPTLPSPAPTPYVLPNLTSQQLQLPPAPPEPISGIIVAGGTANEGRSQLLSTLSETIDRVGVKLQNKWSRWKNPVFNLFGDLVGYSSMNPLKPVLKNSPVTTKSGATWNFRYDINTTGTPRLALYRHNNAVNNLLPAFNWENLRENGIVSSIDTVNGFNNMRLTNPASHEVIDLYRLQTDPDYSIGNSALANFVRDKVQPIIKRSDADFMNKYGNRVTEAYPLVDEFNRALATYSKKVPQITNPSSRNLGAPSSYGVHLPKFDQPSMPLGEPIVHKGHANNLIYGYSNPGSLRIVSSNGKQTLVNISHPDVIQAGSEWLFNNTTERMTPFSLTSDDFLKTLNEEIAINNKSGTPYSVSSPDHDSLWLNVGDQSAYIHLTADNLNRSVNPNMVDKIYTESPEVLAWAYDRVPMVRSYNTIMGNLLRDLRGSGFYEALTRSLHKYGIIFGSGRSGKSPSSSGYWNNVESKNGFRIFGDTHDVEGARAIFVPALTGLIQDRLKNKMINQQNIYQRPKEKE